MQKITEVEKTEGIIMENLEETQKEEKGSHLTIVAVMVIIQEPSFIIVTYMNSLVLILLLYML